MKHYKLLKEHDSHFDLEHEKQGSFVVAKYGLDESTIKKIRSLGAAHYAEGTEDAQGVKRSDAPGLMLAPEDEGTKSTDYLLAPWREYQTPPTDYVTAPEDENMRIAQSVRAREQAPALQDIGEEKWKSAIKWKKGGIPEEEPVSDVLARERGEPKPPEKRVRFIETDLPGVEPQAGKPSFPYVVESGEQQPSDISTTPEGAVTPETSEPKGVKDDFSKTVEGIKENLDVLGQKFFDFFSKKEEEKPVSKEALKPTTSEPKGIKDDLNKTAQSVKENLDVLGKKFEKFLTPTPGQAAPSPPTSVVEDFRKSYEDIKNNFNFLLQKAGVAPTAPKPGVTIQPDVDITLKPGGPGGAGGALPYQQQNQKGLGRGPGGVIITPPTGTQLAGTGRAQDPMKAGEEAFQGLKQANLAMGQIEAQRELDSGQAQLTALNRMRDLDNKYQTNLANIDAEQKRLTDDVMNFKIDPNRVYARMSSGNRMLAAISLVLGGVSQGILGLRSNPAMDVINDTIDRDIDAQKATLGTKQSLLALNLEKYKRLDAATAATRAQLLTVVQAQMNIAAAKANSGLAVKNAQIANYKLDLEKAKLNQSLATQATVGQVLNTQQGVPPEYVMRLPEEIRELLVRVPNGQFFPAINKKAADDANKGLQSVASIKSVLKNAEVLFNQGSIMPWDDTAKGLAQSYSSQLDLEIKNLAGLGVLSESDLEIISRIKPDLTAWMFRDKEKAKLEELNRYINSKVNSFLIQAVPNYSPGSIAEEGVGR